VQVLLLAREMGMLKMGTVALDGTKVHANASKHSALSYEHAGKIEAQLKAEVAELMAKAEAADKADLPDGMSIPDELARREEPCRAALFSRLAQSSTAYAPWSSLPRSGSRVAERDLRRRRHPSCGFRLGDPLDFAAFLGIRGANLVGAHLEADESLARQPTAHGCNRSSHGSLLRGELKEVQPSGK